MGHFWGPAFPDAAGATFTVPAVAASLSLAPTVTNSGALDNASIRALAPGTGGNSIRVQFVADALVDTGEYEEDGNDVTIRFVGGATTVSDIANLIAVASSLVEPAGTWNPSDKLQTGDDEFTLTSLSGGLAPRAGQRVTFWGPHFPDGASVEAPAVSGTGTETVATLALALDAGASVSFGWSTDVIKSFSGLEHRASLLDDPKQSYRGAALLLGDQVASVRNQLARYAALGRPFALGLPFEETTLTADADGLTVTVPTTTTLDWANPGQRVVVVAGDGTSADAVIQSTTATTITVDEGLGLAGVAGARIMPTMPVLLDPQQGFQRYRTPDGAERWSLRARAAIYGFEVAAVPAELALDPPVANSGALDGCSIRARTPGTGGNSITVTFSADALVSTGELDEDAVAGTVHVKFIPGDTSVGDIQTLLAVGSSLVTLVGVSNAAFVLQTGDDEFTAQPLSGGTDEAPGEMGRGATVTTMWGRSVWDRGVRNPGTIDDSLQSLAEVVDLGGIPIGIGAADVPDWGRKVAIESGDRGDDWQWVKAFLFAVRGRWKAFWLSTYRQDLLAVGNGPDGGTSGNFIIDDDVGDFDLWFSRGYDRIEIVQGGETYYVKINSATPNGDGTTTLIVTVDTDDPTNVIPAAAPITRISWLELCRFEADEIEPVFDSVGFAMSASARVVQPMIDGALSSWSDYDESIEESEPREGIEIVTPSVTHRIATGSRDITIDGKTFSAEPAAREAVGVARVGETSELSLRLPVSHAFVQRYLQDPAPRRVEVNVYRKQASDDAVTIWTGLATSCGIDDHIARIRVVSRAGESFMRRLPTITVGQLCPHMLYDDNCRVSRAGFRVSTTIATISGNVVTVASIGGNPDQWAQFGELVHLSSGERMPISDQTGTAITMQFEIIGMAVGDSVEVYAGCDHAISTCDTKFDNEENFGGEENLPHDAVFLPSGFSVIQQE